MPPTERLRSDHANAEVLLWQTGYRLGLAVAAGLIAVGLRVLGSLQLSPEAAAIVGDSAGDWLPGVVTIGYVVLVIGIRQWVVRQRRAGRTLSTLMVVADLAIVFWLVFLLAPPANYDIALFVALISLQLTHVYFGRSPALLMLAAMAAAYLLLNDIAAKAGGDVVWPRVWVRLVVFGAGGLLVTRVQSNLHDRLSRLVEIFQRAEEGDFSESYDVASDRRPDAITSVGRAYNRMRSQLASIVLTDPLSGCFNRRGFEQQYRRELARAARAHTDVSLVALDIDHFKRINDTYGHLVGDQVISEVGELLRANARAEDVVARTGGEEFMILAPNTSPEGAQLLAARVLEAFRRRTFGEPRARIVVTVSAGVVSDAVHDDGIAEALRARADEALYAAKRGGRDRWVMWGGRNVTTPPQSKAAVGAAPIATISAAAASPQQ